MKHVQQRQQIKQLPQEDKWLTLKSVNVLYLEYTFGGTVKDEGIYHSIFISTCKHRMEPITPSPINRRGLAGPSPNYGSTSQTESTITQSSSAVGIQLDSESESNENINVLDENFTSVSQYHKLSYYLPCSSWVGKYNRMKFLHDIIAGLSLASFQIPLSISYATSLAHTDPLSGLYSLGITPFVYAIFGSVPSMIVGPEAAISLVIGQAVETLVAHREDITSIQIITVTTFLAGLSLLIVGILRLGFLGTVLSRALLRGFIGSVGFVMILNSLISELKLNQTIIDVAEHYHTPFQKILFLVKYGPTNYHKPTITLSLIVFVVLLVLRSFKKRYIVRYKWIVFLPEILLVIIIVTFFSYQYDFKRKYGISVVGQFNSQGFEHLNNPVSKANRSLLPILGHLAVITATLGFFESITASKALGGIDNTVVSSNRELIALGLMNIIGSAFGVLPSFGGYGRSKINLKSGAETVVAGVCMGIITILTAKYFLPVIHYIPNCVLSVITTLVGLTLLEDIPKDVLFHIRCRGYNELFVFLLTILTTFFYSVELGICIGCLYSVVTIIKHSAKSRIQILAKVEGVNQFTNVIDYMDIYEGQDVNIEHIEGCLLVKIPEPLTFTNTEDMKERLDRVKRFGAPDAHPGSKEISRENIEYVIFDLHGLTYLDSSAAQILFEIIKTYQEDGSFVFFARVPRKKSLRHLLRESGILNLLETNMKRVAEVLPSCPISRSSYFISVEDAFMLIGRVRQVPHQYGQVEYDGSTVSKTLINSNLV